MMIDDVIMMPKGCLIGREIADASFDEWVTHVFDRPPAAKHWRWNEDFINWAVPAAKTVGLLARTFEELGTVLKQFTDNQVADGLEYISNASLSDIALTLWDESIPRAARMQAVNSIRNLYSDLFAVRCSSFLSHLGETSGHPLNDICYMWWDVLPFRFEPKNPVRQEMDDEFLAVMEFALELESSACQESALHGMGHWSRNRGCLEYVQPAIDRFLMANPHASPGLITYALAAREGRIL